MFIAKTGQTDDPKPRMGETFIERASVQMFFNPVGVTYW
jgi:hypothetical protein